LVAGAVRRLRRFLGVGMHAERVVLIPKAELAFKLLLDTLQSRLDLLTIWAFVVGELNHGDRCRRRSARRNILHTDRRPRWPQTNDHLRLRADRLLVGVLRLGQAPLAEGLDNLVFDRFVWLGCLYAFVVDAERFVRRVLRNGLVYMTIQQL